MLIQTQTNPAPTICHKSHRLNCPRANGGWSHGMEQKEKTTILQKFQAEFLSKKTANNKSCGWIRGFPVDLCVSELLSHETVSPYVVNSC